MPANAEWATVERFVVVSNRDGEHVVGPLDNRGDADAECDRLREEQSRNWFMGGETAIGEPLKPPGYTVESINVPDAEARRGELKRELARIAADVRKNTAPKGIELDDWRRALESDREQIEAELDA